MKLHGKCSGGNLAGIRGTTPICKKEWWGEGQLLKGDLQDEYRRESEKAKLSGEEGTLQAKKDEKMLDIVMATKTQMWLVGTDGET